MKRAWFLAVLLACGGEGQGEGSATQAAGPAGAAAKGAANAATTPEPAGKQAAVPEPHVARASEPLARVRTCRGAGAAATGLADGQSLSAGARIELPEGRTCELYVADVASVRLGGPLLAVVAMDELGAGLVLHDGTLTIDVSIESPAVPGFWVATASGHLYVVKSARAAVRAFADGRSLMTLVSGHARASAPRPGSLTAQDKPELLDAGGLLETRLGVGPKRVRTSLISPSTLESAETRLRSYPPTEPASEPARAAARTDLAQAIDELDAHEARERTLLEQHAALLERGARHDALDVQRALAEHAARLSRMRPALLVRAETALALHPGSLDVQALVERARTVASARAR